jgi:hypothetical protein
LLKTLEYNTAEGLVLNASAFYEKNITPARRITVMPTVRYGFNNTHLNAWADVTLRERETDMDKKIRRTEWAFSGGKRVSQFNKESPITPLVNSISTLLYGDNFMKTYENYFAATGFTQRFENGLRFNVKALYEDRVPLNNTTKFTVFKSDSVDITPNYPYEKIASQFNRYQAVIVSADISFKPGQQYIQFPYRKVAIGSKYPTFTLNYTRGLNGIFGSDVNFDKWKFNVANDNNFKLWGLLKYNVGVGGFLNNKTVYIQDYQHFNGNRSTLAAEYLNSFQLSSYYANSTTAKFYGMAHIEHHFNGLLTNKIPGFNQLNWNLVAGTNTFYINQLSNHVELFAGLENILKIFRVDFITAFENGGRRRTSAISIGFGGLLGGTINKVVNTDKTNGF